MDHEEGRTMEEAVDRVLKLRGQVSGGGGRSISSSSSSSSRGRRRSSSSSEEWSLVEAFMSNCLPILKLLLLLLLLLLQVECEGPNMRINSFTGVFRPEGGENPDKNAVPIDNDNVILRGSVLRNTKWLIGMVVYTGADTKLQVRR